MSTAAELRALLANNGDYIIDCPGVYDGSTTRPALDARFKFL